MEVYVLIACGLFLLWLIYLTLVVLHLDGRITKEFLKLDRIIGEHRAQPIRQNNMQKIAHNEVEIDLDSKRGEYNRMMLEDGWTPVMVGKSSMCWTKPALSVQEIRNKKMKT